MSNRRRCYRFGAFERVRRGRKLRFETLLCQKQLNYRFSTLLVLRLASSENFLIQCTQCVVIVILVVVAGEFLHTNSIERGAKWNTNSLWTLALSSPLLLLFWKSSAAFPFLANCGIISKRGSIFHHDEWGERTIVGMNFNFSQRYFCCSTKTSLFFIAPLKSFFFMLWYDLYWRRFFKV